MKGWSKCGRQESNRLSELEKREGEEKRKTVCRNESGRKVVR